MNNLESHVLNVLINAPTLSEAANRITRIIEEAMNITRKQGEITIEKLSQAQDLLSRFYAHEGRTAGFIEAVALLDQGLKRRQLREALANRARKYHGQMAHYHVMLKVMQ